MTDYETYVFFLCLIVFIALTTLFVTMLTYIVKQEIRLIRCGEEDEKIKQEYTREKKKRSGLKAVDCIVSFVLCTLMLVFFIFSFYVNISQDVYFDNFPTLKVVSSGSMTKKIKRNTYLFENNLNDQISTFDLILTYKMPDEFDLELYDIVVYEVEDTLVVHRIVGIEEPNKDHPNERWFTCQGDAVERPDRFPVHYSQMKGIYKGERIAFIGSFIMFMQSPAGWMCVLLVIFAMVATPIVEKKIASEKAKRFKIIAASEEKQDATV